MFNYYKVDHSLIHHNNQLLLNSLIVFVYCSVFDIGDNDELTMLLNSEIQKYKQEQQQHQEKKMKMKNWGKKTNGIKRIKFRFINE